MTDHNIITEADILENTRNFKLKHPKVGLWILTPCFASLCYVKFVTSLIKTMDLFRQIDIPIFVEFCGNDSLVSRARNNMIARAMNSDSMTHVLFIDNDISWNPIDVLKLLFSEKDIIGGIYPLKRYHWSRLVPTGLDDPVKTLLQHYENSAVRHTTTKEEFIQQNLLNYNMNYLQEKTLIQNGSLCEVKHVATGFMMIRREVIEKMSQSFPSTKYVDDVGYLNPEENQYAYALFDCGVEDGHYFSEDWMFCHRWRNMGGSIFMDISIKLSHTGIEEYNGFILSTIGGT